ncbi:MAG: 6-carboxytetrahydropterin synthase [Acidobacteria bacterium]|nr:6-carboxytetrahydropterin synthase [Acidobacteriota bacterium]
MFITRRVEFSASHICADPARTGEDNRAVYGAEANPQGHGHNFVLEVTLQGEPDPVTGMVFDLKRLKEILNEEIVEPFDHRFLNYEVPPFDRVIPTVENVAQEIWRRLAGRLNAPGVRLHAVRLYETADLFVEVFGDC